MQFYDCETAPSPRRVRMFIAEKNLDIETVEINLREREQLEPGFRAINPHATVPALRLDDGTVLTTTAGCRAYLEAKYPEPPLLGVDATTKGVVADWIWRVETDGFMAVGECLRNRAKGMKGRALAGPVDYEQIPELAERGRRRAEHFFGVIEERIANREFLAIDTLTAADIDAFIFVEFAKWIKLEIPEHCANLRRWHAAIAARPSAV